MIPIPMPMSMSHGVVLLFSGGADPLQVPAFSSKAIRSVKVRFSLCHIPRPYIHLPSPQVMRETGKGPGDLLPRSKGFGFVEVGR